MADNLLDKASILLTPTAYNDGSMLSVKPNENLYGSELVTNGNFATDSDWTAVNSGGWTISGGSANCDGTSSASAIYQQNILVVGKTYKITFTAIITSGTVAVSAGFSGTGTSRTVSGTYTEILTAATNDELYIKGTSNFTGSIDNVSVVEDLSGDFTFSRSSAATRVNAQGLVENVQIISPELVSNGNFSQIGTEEVSNGNFSQEGSELITNGDFSNGLTNWSVNGGSYATIVGGALNSNNTENGSWFAENISQSVSFVQNKIYKVTFKAKNISGNLNLRITHQSHIIFSENITSSFVDYTVYYTAQANNDSLRIFCNDAVGQFQIDNISVKEVGQNWTFDTGWSIEDGQAICNGVGINSLQQSGITTTGKIYKLTFDIISKSSDDFLIISTNFGDTYISGSSTSLGTNTFYINPTSGTGIRFRVADGTTLTIDNVSVKEVGQDWTFGTGWSVDQANSKVVGDGTSFTYITQSPISIQNKKVKLTFDISDYVSGTFRLLPSDRQDGLDERFSGNGSYEVVYISTLDTFRFQQQAFNGSITNISVKEITDDTDLPRINYEGFSYQDSLGSEEIVNGGFDTSSNWTINGGNAEILNGKLNFNNAANYGTSVNNSGIVVSGKTYLVEYTISDYVSGSSQIRLGNQFGTSRNSNGTFSEYIVANNNLIRLYPSSNNTTLSIDNVSVKEVLGQEVVPDSGCGSWLLEPQSTNLVTYSEDFSNITDYALTVTDNSTISPENINNGTSLVPSTVNTVHYLTFPNTSTGTVTFTVYAKANGYNYIFLHLYDGSNGRAWFNLDTGVVGTKDSSVTSEMIAMTNGWYRCSVTRVLSGSLIQADIAVSNADNATTFSGNGTSGIFIYGAQLEQQSYATSYIPTNGATSTRLQDIANNSGNSTLINSTEGVLYAEIAALADDDLSRYITLTDGVLNNNAIRLLYHSSSATFFQKYVNGVRTTNLSTSSIVKTDFNKIAIRYNSTSVSVFVNGVNILNSTDTNTITPNTLSKLSFDIGASTQNFYGKAKALVVYKEALTDAELQSLTTI